MSSAVGRVLFVQGTAERYGSDRSLLLLAAGFRSRGWDVTVALPTHGPLADDLAAADVRVEITPVGAFRRVFAPRDWLYYVFVDLPGAMRKVRRLAKAVDIVHVNTSILLGAAVGARLARRPVVWHIRESYADHRRQWAVYGRLVDRLATTVIANSTPIANEAPTRRMRQRVRVISNGLQFGLVPPPPPSDGGVVTVGRINAGKGQDQLVDALVLLRNRGIVLRASIAGDVFPGTEVYRDRLLQRITDAGLTDCVALVGFVDDVAGLLAQHSIFVLPSRRPESFGLALVEAMAAGLACVATDVGGPTEIVDDGVNGLLVPPGDPVRLADALEALCKDETLRRTLGTNAARDVRDRFDIERTVDAVETVYRELLPQRRRHGQ